MDSTSSKTRYDVFLSFRGEDTRHNFTSHLYAAFCRKCITTFIDDKLERGDEISRNLLKAIEESKLSLIIFSENYASSRWCLDELLNIMESKKTKSRMVLPLFYHVDPSDIRKQAGSFGVGFGKVKEKFKDRIDMVQKWSSALMEAANLSGWDSNNFRHEAELIERVVDEIMKKLYPSFYTTCIDLVGIDAHIEQLRSLLCSGSDDVLFIGIWGMGGIGKTTIAEAVFSRISDQFDACHFLSDVRSSKDDLVHLRKCLFSELLQDRNLRIEMLHALPTSVVDRLTRKKVLVVLDDVDDPAQLESLVGNHGWFGPGSRAIITSRDKEVFKDTLIDRIYEVEGLDDVDALQLLSMKAFRQKHPPDDFMELSNMVVNYAKGVPLALKVLGSHLCKRSPMAWESALNKLKQGPDSKIKKILQISYDSLDTGEKDIFLDIACFFKNEDKKWVEDILAGCGFAAQWGIIRLMDKCLISVVDNKLKMHDLIQEMGQDIARQNGSRFWNAEEICHMLRSKKGKKVVEGILLDISKMGVVHLSSKAFKPMDNLRVLKFYRRFSWDKYTGFVLDSDHLKALPTKLSLFHWDDYPYKSLPSNFFMDNLVELNLQRSKIEQLWDGVKCPAKLKRLFFSSSVHLKRLPDLSSATNLEEIDIESCTNLVAVPSLNHLKSLKTLVLSHCSNLKILPEIPRGIEKLALEGCGMEEWPVSIQYLDNLKTLYIWDCANLRRLPSTIHLNSSGTLNLRRCMSLQNLPEIMGNLKTLELTWSGKELPSSIVSLSKLVVLKIVECIDLETLPDNISELKYLESLNTRGCSKLGKLPELPCRLSNLAVQDCTLLKAASSSSSSFEIKENPGKEMYFEFNYSNCLKLDQKARCNIMEDAKLRIEKLLAATVVGNFEPTINVSFPGSEIPEWIRYQNEGSSIVIPLPPCGLNTLLGFSMCFVLQPHDGHIPLIEFNDLDYQCKCSFIDASGNQESYSAKGFIPMVGLFEADHVLLSFVNAILFFSESDQSLLSDIIGGETCPVVNEVVFDFSAEYLFSEFKPERREELIKLKVKRCGAQPFYAKDKPSERDNNGYVEQVIETDNGKKRREREISDDEEPQSKRLK